MHVGLICIDFCLAICNWTKIQTRPKVIRQEFISQECLTHCAPPLLLNMLFFIKVQFLQFPPVCISKSCTYLKVGSIPTSSCIFDIGKLYRLPNKVKG